ncbi:YtpI family protein [Sporosarcina sp. G11-34]|uniref:YtpI family protein n=1 Tax=Sporosarcina sp. G11-34 TaxID=2849605 RepID=UPI0022A9D1C9|nr:YtpI family protein [Sporosarcina sp. G11-34]MCZ2257983.1 YtpI family protein [Sporosarcina sp. G11-34]
MLNLIFVFLIIGSGVFYFYFKYRQFRTTYVLPIRKKMYASRAGTYLGSLLIFFGLNQFMLDDGIARYIVAAIFVPLGLYVTIFNFRAHKHYKQFVAEEAELNKTNA